MDSLISALLPQALMPSSCTLLAVLLAAILTCLTSFSSRNFGMAFSWLRTHAQVGDFFPCLSPCSAGSGSRVTTSDGFSHAQVCAAGNNRQKMGNDCLVSVEKVALATLMSEGSESSSCSEKFWDYSSQEVEKDPGIDVGLGACLADLETVFPHGRTSEIASDSTWPACHAERKEIYLKAFHTSNGESVVGVCGHATQPKYHGRDLLPKYGFGVHTDGRKFWTNNANGGSVFHPKVEPFIDSVAEEDAGHFAELIQAWDFVLLPPLYIFQSFSSVSESWSASRAQTFDQQFGIDTLLATRFEILWDSRMSNSMILELLRPGMGTHVLQPWLVPEHRVTKTLHVQHTSFRALCVDWMDAGSASITSSKGELLLWDIEHASHIGKAFTDRSLNLLSLDISRMKANAGLTTSDRNTSVSVLWDCRLLDFPVSMERISRVSTIGSVPLQCPNCNSSSHEISLTQSHAQLPAFDSRMIVHQPVRV